MEQTHLSAQVREKTGKGVARRLRAQKLIPAVVYGPRVEKPLNIAVDPKALKAAIQTSHRFNTLLTLQLEGGGERTALLKDYQQDPVSRSLLHADFFEVRMDEEVIVPVPLELVGKPAGVLEGGILEQPTRVVDVVCLPNRIPEKIEVDVNDLKVNAAMHISEVKGPEGVTLRFLSDFVVALITLPDREETPVAAAAPAAADAAKGAAAPAAGAAAGAAKAPAKK